MKSHDCKQIREEKVYFEFTSTSKSTTKGSLDRSLGAGTDVEAVEECCLLACSPWLAESASL